MVLEYQFCGEIDVIAKQLGEKVLVQMRSKPENVPIRNWLCADEEQSSKIFEEVVKEIQKYIGKYE